MDAIAVTTNAGQLRLAWRGIDEISQLARRHLTETIFPAQARAYDGSLRLTLAKRSLPQEWLWHPDRFLPVLLAVGALRRGGAILPVRPDAAALTGYSLADEPHPYADDLLDAAFEVIVPERHFAEGPGGEYDVGTHLETMMLLDRSTFWHVIATQGYPATWLPTMFSGMERFCSDAFSLVVPC